MDNRKPEIELTISANRPGELRHPPMIGILSSPEGSVYFVAGHTFDTYKAAALYRDTIEDN
jgi:hypothetical protein